MRMRCLVCDQINIKQAAEILEVTPSRARVLLANAGIAKIAVGRRQYVDKATVVALEEARIEKMRKARKP